MQGGVDGGIRVPTIVRWPGRVTPASRIDEPLSNMDFFSTFAELVGRPVPGDRPVDGASLVPLLTGETERSPHEFLIHYCQDKVHAVRWRPPEGALSIDLHTSAWFEARLTWPKQTSCRKNTLVIVKQNPRHPSLQVLQLFSDPCNAFFEF